jgi:hypothetical protein
MAQSAFETEINDSLMDWEASHNHPAVLAVQSHPISPMVQEGSAINHDNDKDEVFPSSRTTIKARRSIKVLLASGEYTLPDLV